MSTVPVQETNVKAAWQPGRNGGRLKTCGDPKHLPNPGPGRKSDAQKAKEQTARELEDAEFERMTIENYAKVVKAAFDAWEAGNPSLMKDLKDRHPKWGKPREALDIRSESVQIVIVCDESRV